MTIVFVHGNPETPAVWEPLLAQLAGLGYRDTVCLSPPGFGAPVPDGFEATVEGYRQWLVAQLEGFDAPVDLVGHDWGGGHTVNVATTRPDLLRSWVSDILGVYEPEYVWHELAQAWQTPGVGEEHVAQLLGGSDAERAERLVGIGMTPQAAQSMAPAQDETMQRCILTLYRSAAQPVMADLGRRLPDAAARPGLAIVAEGDGFVGDGARGAARAGARVAHLAGVGHWWMLQDPAAGAQALHGFWSDLT